MTTEELFRPFLGDRLLSVGRNGDWLTMTFSTGRAICIDLSHTVRLTIQDEPELTETDRAILRAGKIEAW